MNPILAVIIATKNRAEAIREYALTSLNRSEFREFVCVVWDASDDDLTGQAVERGDWNFRIDYSKAPRAGLTSQRNDAIRHVLASYQARYIVFIDDDSELSPDALSGVLDSFRESGVSIVNMHAKAVSPPSFCAKTAQGLKRLLGMNRHGATSFLYNYGGANEEAGQGAEWASGCGMGVNISVFRDAGIFFPEEFKRFGGYALGEDFAFSFFVFKKGGGRAVNSAFGYFHHYAAGSARLDVEKMAASKWYNFHLLFDTIYDDVEPERRPALRFKFFMCAAALKLLIRARSLNAPAVLKGILAARAELRRYYENHDPRSLMYPLKRS